MSTSNSSSPTTSPAEENKIPQYISGNLYQNFSENLVVATHRQESFWKVL